jgi:hypothetical protein
MAIPTIPVPGYLNRPSDPAKYFLGGADLSLKSEVAQGNLAVQAQKIQRDRSMLPLDMRAQQAQTNLITQNALAKELSNELDVATFEQKVNLSGLQVTQAAEDLRYSREMHPLEIQEQIAQNQNRELVNRQNSITLGQAIAGNNLALKNIAKKETSAAALTEEMEMITRLFDDGKADEKYWETYRMNPNITTVQDQTVMSNFINGLQEQESFKNSQKDKALRHQRDTAIVTANGERIANLLPEYRGNFANISGMLGAEHLKKLGALEETSKLLEAIPSPVDRDQIRSDPGNMETLTFTDGTTIEVLSPTGKVIAENTAKRIAREKAALALEPKLRLNEQDAFFKLMSDQTAQGIPPEVAARSAMTTLGYSRVNVLASEDDVNKAAEEQKGPRLVYNMLDLSNPELAMWTPPGQEGEEEKKKKIPKAPVSPENVSELKPSNIRWFSGDETSAEDAGDIVQFAKEKETWSSSRSLSDNLSETRQGAFQERREEAEKILDLLDPSDFWSPTTWGIWKGRNYSDWPMGEASEFEAQAVATHMYDTLKGSFGKPIGSWPSTYTNESKETIAIPKDREKLMRLELHLKRIKELSSIVSKISRTFPAGSNRRAGSYSEEYFSQ